MAEFAANTRVGLWVDELRLGLRAGLKTAAEFRAESAGLDAFSAELSPLDFGQTARRGLRRYVSAQGLALAALRADTVGRRLADARALEVNLGRVREAARVAADLGAARLVVPAGFLPAAEDKKEADAREALTEAAKVLCSLASSMAVRICWLGGGEKPEVLAAFLAEVDASGILDVDLNPGAYLMRGQDPLSALNVLAARVSVVTAADHYRGGAEAPFGQGDVQWGEIIVGLSALRRSIPVDVLATCGLEGGRSQALARACARLRALRANPLG